MALAAGTRVGQYEILALAGAGGMGEVYRARDTRLKRDVGLKVLPAALVHDPARLARFQREAEILASLNHAGIATVHGFVESGDTHAIVMEFVEGETLAERLKQGPLPVATAQTYARQIIEALEYAHDHGITHRDLKPANVMITPEGSLKLLDFGLAKAVEDPSPLVSAADSPTLTLGQTRAGTILGTAAYMSPEQAVGKTADRRSDVFSFGAVLYEMLTGRRAFGGDSGPEILASVVKDDPDWSRLPGDTPEPLRGLLRRCLVKDRRQRMQAIGEARIALDAPAEVVQRSPAKAGATRWIAAAALMTIVAGVALWGWLAPRPTGPLPLIHFATALPEGGMGGVPPALSRDGSRLVFVGLRGKQLYMRTLDDPVAKPIAGTEGGQFATFSPDGTWIAFMTNAPFQLKKIPVAGGAALTLAEGLNGNGPPSWGDDDTILMTGDTGVQRVPAAGGKMETVATADPKNGEVAFLFAEMLPGGEYMLVDVLTQKGLTDLRLAAIHIRTGERKVLLEGAGAAWFARSGPQPHLGHLVYGRNQALFAVPFNARTLEAGSPSPVLEGVQGVGGLVVFGFSHSGTLAYEPGSGLRGILPLTTLMWVDRKGGEQPLPAPARFYNRVRISPEGGRIAAEIPEFTQTIAADIWVYEIARQTLTKVTFERLNGSAAWSPDGKRLIHNSGEIASSAGQALLSTADDSSGQPATLGTTTTSLIPSSISRDGWLIGRAHGTGAAAANQLLVVRLKPDGKGVEGKPEPLLDARFARADPEFSPDGKWVAFASDQTGRNEIYVVPFPGAQGISQVSVNGGTQPRWSRNGRELFFREGDKLMAVDVELGAAFRAGTPRMLFEKASPDYDVAADGRFLMLKPAAPAGEADAPNELHVIVNWFEELRRRVPLK